MADQPEKRPRLTPERELWKALSAGDRGRVEELLAAGVSADAPTGGTDVAGRARHAPLHFAAHTGDLALLKLLLSHGARLDGGNELATPVLSAAGMEEAGCVDGLLERGAARTLLVDAALGDLPAVRAWLTADAALVHLVDEDGAGALHHAAGVLRTSVVGALIDAGAEVDARDRHGATPLHRACNYRACNHRGDAAERTRRTFERLLAAGADVNAANRRKVSPLHVAVRSRNAAGVRLLLEAGAEVDAEDAGRGSTPLRRAVTQTGAGRTGGRQEAALEIARSLLRYGADPARRDAKGRTVLESARGAEMRALLESEVGGV